MDEAVSRDIMDQVMVEEDTAGDTPVEASVPEECIWRQNITISDSESDTSGIETVLENEARACTVDRDNLAQVARINFYLLDLSSSLQNISKNVFG